MGRSIESVESAKTKILGLTMVPTVGTVYRFVYVSSSLSPFSCTLES